MNLVPVRQDYAATAILLDEDSTNDFIWARPFSNWPPHIFSQFTNKPNILAPKLDLPDIVHVTTVWPPSGWNVNCTAFVAVIGLKNSSRKRTNSPDLLSVIVLRPAPIL